MRSIPKLFAELTSAAEASGLTASTWARKAGLAPESLSRLKHRRDCDFSTLARLADALDLEWQLAPRKAPRISEDGLFPLELGRNYEERLLQLVASGNTDPEYWRTHGPSFFMAGIAVLLSETPSWTRNSALALADRLHTGITEPSTFQVWLDRSPLRPARFLPLLEQAHATV